MKYKTIDLTKKRTGKTFNPVESYFSKDRNQTKKDAYKFYVMIFNKEDREKTALKICELDYGSDFIEAYKGTLWLDAELLVLENYLDFFHQVINEDIDRNSEINEFINYLCGDCELFDIVKKENIKNPIVADLDNENLFYLKNGMKYMIYKLLYGALNED